MVICNAAAESPCPAKTEGSQCRRRAFEVACGWVTIAAIMRRIPGTPGRQPVPEPLVTELIRAGISRSTVLAMERWKAQEVFDLLYSAHLGDGLRRTPELLSRGRAIASLGGPASSPAGPVLGFSTQD